MRPLAECPPALLGSLRGVLTDIDDTLTTDGRLTAQAYAAMECLQQAGLQVVPVTGRPAGWCDHIARMWPVDAVVGENGAFWFRYLRGERRMLRHYALPEDVRRAQASRLREIGAEIVRQIPGARVAADQAYREADLAIDYCEDVPALGREAVDRIVALMQGAGLTAKVSSIHVNGWFGEHDKLATSLVLLLEQFGCRPEQARSSYAYIGDSPNDEPMFAFFECSIGVANVLDFAQRLHTPPRYVTMDRCGAGFAQLAQLLSALAAR